MFEVRINIKGKYSDSVTFTVPDVYTMEQLYTLFQANLPALYDTVDENPIPLEVINA